VKLLDVIEDYAAAMVMGAEFPPVVVFYDGEHHWLADGYHRRDAAVAAGLSEILADIRQGTRRDAILFSVGANAAHGLRRTNEDKKRAVLTLLKDAAPECANGHVCRDGRHWSQQCWATWSDSQIARQCAVDHKTVATYRPPPILGNSQDTQRVVQRGGTTYTMNTGRIGGNGSADRPVFDNSRFADPRPSTPVESTRPTPAVDMSMSHLWRGLRDVVETIKSLPTPADTIEDFPRDLEHALRADDVVAASEWLAEFADLWAAGQRARDERTAALVQRTKELRDHVAAD